MIDTKAIGKRIQGLRRATGMTQEQAAECLGISPNYVSNIETGRESGSTIVLLGMANLYHASVEYILGESLEYNRRNGEGGENREALLHEIGRLQESECGHLLRYIRLMQSDTPDARN